MVTVTLIQKNAIISELDSSCTNQVQIRNHDLDYVGIHYFRSKCGGRFLQELQIIIY